MKMLEKVIKESKTIIKDMKLGIDTDIPITLNGRLSRSLGRTLKTT